MQAVIQQLNTSTDSSVLMSDFSIAFGGVIFFWLLGLCIGALVKMIGRA